MAAVLYVYAITGEAVTPVTEGVDGSDAFGSVTAGGVAAVFSRVAGDDYSQDAIDRRASDVEWLGAIGYRHQAVVSELMKKTAVVPLRAFTLFSSEEALCAYLDANAERLRKALARLDGKQEWTLRVEFEPERWHEALAARVGSLRELQEQIEAAAAGRAYLLRKKLDEEKKKASREAERQVVAEIERIVLEKLGCDTVAESRERREGAFPQINVLLDRDEEARLQELHADLIERYAGEGVTLAITGPWPPYTFAGAERDD